MPPPPVKSIAKWYVCGNSPSSNVLNYAWEGATKGALLGAIALSEAGPLGLIAGGLAGAGTGVFGGLALAVPVTMGCQWFGAYGQQP
jgi:hypothetical protein